VVEARLWTTPGSPSKPSTGPEGRIVLGSYVVSTPGNVVPGLFDFNKVHKFVKQARKKPIAHVTPITRTDIPSMSSKTVSTTNPPIVDVILDII
jgi:hypothetical protein